MWSLWNTDPDKPKNEVALVQKAEVVTEAESEYKVEVVWQFNSYYDKYMWTAVVYRKERHYGALEWYTKGQFHSKNKESVIRQAEEVIKRLKRERALLIANKAKEENRFYK